jgi:hypothetical protein
VTYQLPPDQLTEIQKLLKLAQDVETGKASLADVDDDGNVVIESRDT